MDRKYKLVIFDLDGTLIDSLPIHLLAFEDLLRERGITASRKYIKRLIGMTTSDILKSLKKRYRLRENVQDLREERRYHYFKFLGNRDVIFPGVRKALQRLKGRCKIAIATGSSKIILTHSTDGKFQRMFDAVVTINDVKKGKPHPYQFLLAARTMRLRPAECLVVGDSLYDAIAAKRANMDFVGVTTGYTANRILRKYCAMGSVRSIAALEKRLRY